METVFSVKWLLGVIAAAVTVICCIWAGFRLKKSDELACLNGCLPVFVWAVCMCVLLICWTVFT